MSQSRFNLELEFSILNLNSTSKSKNYEFWGQIKFLFWVSSSTKSVQINSLWSLSRTVPREQSPSKQLNKFFSFKKIEFKKVDNPRIQSCHFGSIHALNATPDSRNQILYIYFFKMTSIVLKLQLKLMSKKLILLFIWKKEN